MSKPQIWKHMAEKDTPLFASWVMSEEGQTYDNFEFDVLVGDPRDPGPFYPPSQRYQALYLNALRIDAVAWRFHVPTLIECKPNANLGCFGQIVGYRTWYELIFNVKPLAMILTAHISDQIQTLCTINNVTWRIVPPGNDFLVQQALTYTVPRIKELSIMPQIVEFVAPDIYLPPPPQSN